MNLVYVFLYRRMCTLLNSQQRHREYVHPITYECFQVWRLAGHMHVECVAKLGLPFKRPGSQHLNASAHTVRFDWRVCLELGRQGKKTQG